MPEAIFWTAEEIANRAQQLYETQIRFQVETPDNIGKMLVIDVETSEYAIDLNGVESAIKLKEKRPTARLFTIRIGSDVAVSFGG
jgi:electron transfer flavoprotein alpha/beta subunit